MRQLTFTNKALGDLVAEKTILNIDSATTSVSAYKDGIELAIENIAKEVTVTRLVTPPVAGTATKITYNADGLVTAGAAIALTDFPSIASGTFIGRTAAGSGVPSAISAANVITTIGAVPTSRTVAGNALSADVTRDNLIGVSSAGFVKRSATANTYTSSSTVEISELANISSGTFLGRVAANSGAVSALSRDSVIGVSSNGLVRRTGANTYENDSTSYAPLTSVALKASGSPIDPSFWVGSQAQYDAIVTKNSAVVYIIT
jgi:hypothetical protein